MGGDPRIDLNALRERLRALGYLDAGVDRFLLAPARKEGGAVGLAWRISVRIGLLAALLLGPAAAIGIASRLPGLISGPRDAVVVTLYLAAVFGVATAVAAWIVALAVRAAARGASPASAKRIGIAAGALTGIACLAYLTLWWGAAAGAAWSSPVRTIVALAAAVAVSLLVGHAVAVSALALLARDGGTALSVRAPSISWRATLVTGAIAFVAASGFLAVSSLQAEAPITPPSLVVVPTGVRVLVIGIDGWNPAVMSAGPLVELPNIDRVAEETAQNGAPLDTDPARVWTTVATGEPAERHGVTGLELRRVTGLEGSVSSGYSTITRALATVTDLARLTRPAAVTGTIRSRKTFWEVAAESGLDVAVVNWWATWPATNTRATVISDRAALRLEQGGPQSAEIAPEPLYRPLLARWPEIVREAESLSTSLVGALEGEDERDAILRSARIDAQHALLARDPLLGTPDLLAVYLPGLDIAQHALLVDEDTSALGPAALGARLDAIRRYYLFVDRLVGKLVAELPDDFTVLIVTHPGRAGEARPTLSFGGANVVGHPVDAGFRLIDVAPTVLYLLGVPMSDELAGQPLLQFFAANLVRTHPVRRVASYGRHEADLPRSEGSPLDKETLERLRSLGYIR